MKWLRHTLSPILVCCATPASAVYAVDAVAPAQQAEAVSTDVLCEWLADKARKSATELNTRSEDRNPSIRVGKISIRTAPIFVEDAETIWLHRIANWAHVTTRQDTVARELPFTEGDLISHSDVAEAERLLRDKSYLHDAKVQLSKSCVAAQTTDILVDTSDNWSLLPSLGLGRSGGENKYALGFKEDNFLGFGVRTSVKYQSDHQRSGYEFKLDMPLSLLTDARGHDWLAHSYLTAEWTDNDDGHVQQLLLEKPFYQDDSRWMMHLEWLSELQQSQIYHNGALENVFTTEHRRFDLYGGQLWSYQHQSSLRLLAGLLQEEWRFTPALLQLSLALPQDRIWSYPWIGLEYKQHHYQVFRDILFIDRAEDVNLGWHHSVKLGLQSRDLQQDQHLGYRILASSRKGFGDRQHLLLLSANLDWMEGLQGGNRREWRLIGEDFFQLHPNLTWYHKLELAQRNRNFADQPLDLGGESGLRGYPLQYQHGLRKTLLTSELRWYPRINLYQMLDLGFVAFADIGRVDGGTIAPKQQLASAALASRFGWVSRNQGDAISLMPDMLQRSVNDLLLPNLTDRWLGSVGIGMRIYSSKSSNDHVIHIDLSTPLQRGPRVDSWEIELNVSNRF